MIPPAKWQEAQEVAKDLPVPQVIQPEKEDVTTYQDKGIQYKGYARKRTGAGNYTTIPQETRFYSYKIQNTAAGTHTITRPNSATHNFYCTTIVIESQGLTQPTMMTLFDDNTNNPRFRVYGDNQETHYTIPLRDCPRLFGGNIVLTDDTGVGALSYFHILLLGWDEEK